MPRRNRICLRYTRTMPDEPSVSLLDAFHRPKLWSGFAAVLCSVLIHLCVFLLWPYSSAPGAPAGVLRAGLYGLSQAPGPVLPEIPAVASRAPVTPNDVRPVPPAPAGGSFLPAQSIARGDDYLSADQLEASPSFPDDMEDHILDSLDDSESGRVVVQLLVAADGSVDKVLLESSGLSEAGTQIFLKHLAALHLQPGMRDGRPAKARWHLEFNFSVAP